MAIQDFYEPLILVEKKRVSDGMGGWINTYVETIEFMGAINMDSSIEAMIAQSQGVKSIYTLTANKNTELKYDDIIKRKNNNKYLRITSNKDDMETPNMSSLDIFQVRAEMYELA